MTSVPDFFQDESEESLRARVDWAERHLGLGDAFFAKLLGEDQSSFSTWRRKLSAALAKNKEGVLRDLWQTILHLLSFQNFDEQRVRTLLEQTAVARPEPVRSVFAPPWAESSLKEYLETYGPERLQKVDEWVESFRFGDPYLPRQQGMPCLSTRR